MTVKERLHNLIDRLPDNTAERIESDIRRICEENDPVLKALMAAPEDDEPLTEEDIRDIEEAYREIERGETYSMEEVHSEIED